MKMFMFKTFCLASLLFIAVLTGMQMANNGIQKMKGSDDPSLNSTVTLNDANKNFQSAALGEEISSHDIQAKKKKLENLSSVNFFSSMGRMMSNSLTNASAKIINSLTK